MIEILNGMHETINYGDSQGFRLYHNVEYEDYVIKTRGGGGVIPKLEQGDALFNSLEHFRQCIVEGRESLTNAQAAIRMIRILEAADIKLKKQE